MKSVGRSNSIVFSFVFLLDGRQLLKEIIASPGVNSFLKEQRVK